MTGVVVDTNVFIVANGRSGNNSEKAPSIECRQSSVAYLKQFKENGYKLVLDIAGEIQDEYKRYLRPNGQPGVGDLWYQKVLRSSPDDIERVDLPKRADGEYQNLPQPVIDSGFDPSDRKFAALAKQEGVSVANAVDGDWLIYRKVLNDNGIHIHFVCGCDRDAWFDKQFGKP